MLFPEKMLTPEIPPTPRRVLPDDWAKYLAILKEALDKTPQAFGKSALNESKEGELEWRNRLEDSGSCFYAVEQNGIFVSVAAAKKRKNNSWMLTSVYTRAGSERQRFSEQCINQVIAEVQKQGAEKVFLYVTDSQEAAITLYQNERMQFVPIPAENYSGAEMADGNEHLLLYMERILS